MITPVYQAGDWNVVVAEGCLALLPADTDPRVLRRLWDSMRRGEDLMGHLVIITDGRFEGLPSFALAKIDGEQVHMMLRGSVRVLVGVDGKQREFSARSVSTWLEQIVDDAVSVSLHPVDCSRQDPAPGVGLPLAAGVVRAGGISVAWGEVPPEFAVGEVAYTEEHSDREASEPVLPSPIVESEDDVALDPVADVASDTEEGSEESASLWIDDEDDEGSESASFEDHDGMTVMNSEVVALRQQLPAWEGDAVPGPMVDTAARRTVPKIVLSTGTAVALDRPVLLGRAPQVSRVRNDEMPRLVTVESPNHDISRTHAEVRMNDDDIMVTDLNSTNGVLLTRPGAVAQRLTSGEPTVVEAGAIVDLGEGVTFVVGRQA